MTETTSPPLFSPDDSVLIVDDEAFSRFMTIELLDRLGKPQILTARDGSEALAILGTPAAAALRVVLLDFNMPGFNGIAVLKAIRSGILAVPHDVVVLMISSIQNLGLVAAAVVLDVDAFLTKPASVAVLRGHLVELLDHPRDCWSPDHYAGLDVDWLSARKMIDTTLSDGETISVEDLREGMIIAADLIAPLGGLLIAAGTRVTPRLLRLMRGLIIAGLPLGNGIRVTRPD
jgi:two-component system chemotaxis response regulator CheY